MNLYHHLMGQPLEDRFWAKVRKDADCWVWVGARNLSGYGKLYRDGKIVAAHRISWELENGPIPAQMNVLHRCDNPPCVKPAHLFLGTPEDNTRDMLAKRRHRAARGEAAGRARLTEDDIRLIRELKMQGVGGREIARRLRAPHSTVWHVLAGHSWRHVTSS